ncbi:MAG TPA: fumarylacetoacetate hydrolase family protein [Polyangiales bacterium]|nr:fumarylacetoacetate hydrolase family protein [Polyangiales bacterium]
MLLTTFNLAGETRLGVVHEAEVIDLARAVDGAPSQLTAALERNFDLHAAGRAAIASRAPRQSLSELSLAPLVPDPGKVICLGLNYYEHAKEGSRDKPDYPWFFLRARSSLLGHAQPALLPRVSHQLDYEAELAVVIGRKVPRHVSAAHALDYVFGYSCFNDMSVRDYQKRTPQWTIGKNFDATGAFGPVLVTADALPPGAAGLTIRSRLHDRVLQSASTADMIFPVAETISLLAQCLTLHPGDVLVMGTPAGVGFARKPPLWLQEGDTIEVEIEGIGLLQNPVALESSR